MTAPKKQSAVDKIQRSKLDPDAVQRELMGDDLDLQSLLVYLKGKIQFDSVERVTDIRVTRTIEGASTVVVSLSDSDKAVLKSGILANRLDIQLDGLWFRLVKVEPTGDILALTFEDREIAILRTYKKLKIAHRSQVTRAEFINNLIKEPAEFKDDPIPVVIPELDKVQPIQKAKDLPYATQTVVDKSGGIPETVTSAQDAHRHGDQTPATAARPTLTVKGVSIDKDQVKNANAIIGTGQTMGARRKVLVAAIMTSIQEATLRNIPYGDRDSLGLFQQRASWGSAETRLDPASSSRMFFNKAIVIDRNEPTIEYTLLCQEVQHSAFPDAYAQWRDEAERIVSAYGVVGKDNESSASSSNNSVPVTTDGSNYIYYRGIPTQGGKTWKKEDSWTCIGRLADEVKWRYFFVSGVFYYITEDDLFESKPLAEIRDTDDGIEGMDGDLDIGKPTSTMTIGARIGTWLIPPGAVLVVEDHGPFTGRWLVSTFERSLFDSKATITLKKSQARLPEPLQNDINTRPPATWATEDTGTSTDLVPTTAVFAGGFLPVGAKFTLDRLDQGRDFITDPGRAIIAPGDGYVLNIGVDPNGFGTSYPIVKFTSGPWKSRGPMYIGHTQSLLAKGATFKAGQKLSITGTTGQEIWNGNASVPGWVELGFAPGGVPGPFGQKAPF